MPKEKVYVVNVRRYKRPDGKFQNRITVPPGITSNTIRIVDGNVPNVFESKKRFYDKN